MASSLNPYSKMVQHYSNRHSPSLDLISIDSDGDAVDGEDVEGTIHERGDEENDTHWEKPGGVQNGMESATRRESYQRGQTVTLRQSMSLESVHSVHLGASMNRREPRRKSNMQITNGTTNLLPPEPDIRRTRTYDFLPSTGDGDSNYSSDFDDDDDDDDVNDKSMNSNYDYTDDDCDIKDPNRKMEAFLSRREKAKKSSGTFTEEGTKLPPIRDIVSYKKSVTEVPALPNGLNKCVSSSVLHGLGGAERGLHARSAGSGGSSLSFLTGSGSSGGLSDLRELGGSRSAKSLPVGLQGESRRPVLQGVNGVVRRQGTRVSGLGLDDLLPSSVTATKKEYSVVPPIGLRNNPLTNLDDKLDLLSDRIDRL